MNLHTRRHKIVVSLVERRARHENRYTPAVVSAAFTLIFHVKKAIQVCRYRIRSYYLSLMSAYRAREAGTREPEAPPLPKRKMPPDRGSTKDQE